MRAYRAAGRRPRRAREPHGAVREPHDGGRAAQHAAHDAPARQRRVNEGRGERDGPERPAARRVPQPRGAVRRAREERPRPGAPAAHQRVCVRERERERVNSDIIVAGRHDAKDANVSQHGTHSLREAGAPRPFAQDHPHAQDTHNIEPHTHTNTNTTSHGPPCTRRAPTSRTSPAARARATSPRPRRSPRPAPARARPTCPPQPTTPRHQTRRTSQTGAAGTRRPPQCAPRTQ